MSAQRYDYKITLDSATDDQIRAALRAEMAKRSPDPEINRAWVRGLILGLILGAIGMASADYGDVWICAGSCADQIKEALE